MLVGPLRLSILAAAAAFGAVGAALAMWGAGLPFLLAALVAAALAGLVQYAALRTRPPTMAPVSTPAPTAAEPDPQAAMRAKLDEYRAHTAMLRHDLRGVLSPALMMSDRLLNHADPAVQRAGGAVVRSIERATALLATSRELMQAPTSPAPAANNPASPAAQHAPHVTASTNAPADPVAPPR